MEKLNNKNFWAPLFIASPISFVILFFGIPYVLFLSLKATVENIQPYRDFFLMSLFAIPLFLILAIPLFLILAFPPVFFIIKRLITKNPKKVFYFELPILIIIYSILLSFNQLFGLMVGGPKDTTFLLFLGLILPQVIFVVLWLVLLTLSLYFYYKKKILKNSN